jgi:hypothetical protein
MLTYHYLHYRALLWRLCRIICGFVLLVLGLFLSIPGIPGPGIVLIVLSFGILSHDFHWAKKIHTSLEQRWHKILQRWKNTTT